MSTPPGQPTRGEAPPPPLGTDLVRGTIAGLVATVPMTLAMKAIQAQLPWWERHPSPPRSVTEGIADRLGVRRQLDRDDRIALTGLSHFAFGAAAGAAYAPLARSVGGHPALTGNLYALAVWGVSYQGWIPAASLLPPATEQSAGRNAMMIVAHLVWGSALGLTFDRLRRRPR